MTRYCIDLTDDEVNALIAARQQQPDTGVALLWLYQRLSPTPGNQLTVEFGESCDDDALKAVFDRLVGFVLTIDGRDVWLDAVAPEGRWSFVVHDFKPGEETEHTFPHIPPPGVDTDEINLDFVDVIVIN